MKITPKTAGQVNTLHFCMVYKFMLQVYSDPQALQYVSGVAVHWYLDSVVPINVLDFTHDLQPDRFIFGSEACNGDLPWEPKVILGGWERGEKYASDIIGVSLVYA